MDRVTLKIKVQPRAKKEEVRGFKDDVLYVRLTAPPVDNAANEALLKLLSKTLNIPKRQISLLQGVKSKNKVVALEGLSEKDLRDIFPHCQSN